jgi:hypothetical protein
VLARLRDTLHPCQPTHTFTGDEGGEVMALAAAITVFVVMTAVSIFLFGRGDE